MASINKIITADQLEATRNKIGFRELEANFAFLDGMREKLVKDTKATDSATLGLLSRVDLESNTITIPSFEKNYKFATNLKSAPRDTSDVYNTVIIALVLLGLPSEYLFGEITEVKENHIVYDNEYSTTIRLWNSKKVGKNIIYEITVATFKESTEISLEGVPMKSL
jgi:hypothetical protein